METKVVFSPIDGALLDCPEGPDLAAAMAQVEAVKYDQGIPPSEKAKLIVGIQGTALLGYQSALTTCHDNLDTIRSVQGKDAPAP